MDIHFSILFLSFVISLLMARGSTSHVNLLKIFKGPKLSKFKDVTKSPNTGSFRFGPNTSDLLVNRKKAKKITWNFNQGKDVTFVALAKLDKIAASGRSTMLSVVSPMLMNMKVFEIYIEKSESLQDVVEGQYLSFDKEYDFSLGVSFLNEGRKKTILTSLKGHLKIGKWFTLVIRFLENSHVEISMNCETLKKEEMSLKIGKIPSFAEIRLSQDAEEDMWTSKKIISNRFIGEIKSAKFLFGEESFSEHNPCAHSSEQGMKIEGVASKEEPLDTYDVPVSIESLFDEENSDCFYNMKTYKDGQKWKDEPCFSCKCQEGKVLCVKGEKCSKKKEEKY